MGRGAPRRHNPTIPAHIDQSKLPKGIYWDATGAGRWYVFENDGPKPRRRTVAQATAKLSELHDIAEQKTGVDRSTLSWTLSQFTASPVFKRLAPRTQQDYERYRLITCGQPTRIGKPFGDVAVALIRTSAVQSLVDTLEAQGTPTKANHMLRYLRRSLQWAVQRGLIRENPARGVLQAKEAKQNTMPTTAAHAAVLRFARERGQVQAHTRGSVAPYLWPAMEIAYLCRLRGIEVVSIVEAQGTPEGLVTARTKGSRDNVVRWSPRLRDAWDAALAIRTAAVARRARPIPLRAQDRPVFVGQDGGPLAKSSLDTAWQRMIAMAIAEGVITPEQRFSIHGLKHRGITDTPGTKADKQQASGHKEGSMVDLYDHSLPLVDPSIKG